MLILIAHGSTKQAWRASVERLTDALQEDLGRDVVRLAYMECTPPTLMDVASDAVRDGAARIRVLPLFLTGEGHVERNVRPLVEEVSRAYPELAVELLPAAGQHPMFRDMLRTIALEDSE
jgi:sirohydrochlorin cobaltochelatase